jgi:hypothetical protein
MPHAESTRTRIHAHTHNTHTQSQCHTHTYTRMLYVAKLLVPPKFDSELHFGRQANQADRFETVVAIVVLVSANLCVISFMGNWPFLHLKDTATQCAIFIFETTRKNMHVH